MKTDADTRAKGLVLIVKEAFLKTEENLSSIFKIMAQMFFCLLFFIFFQVGQTSVAAEFCPRVKKLIEQADEDLVLGSRFLVEQEKYLLPLLRSKDLKRKLIEMGYKKSHLPSNQVLAFLVELEQTHLSHPDRSAILERIKKYYHQKYLIKPKDIPESYFELQRRIAREQGYGDIPITPQMRTQMIESVIEDQKNSLDNWSSYFLSPDTKHYPLWAKVWAFEYLSKMGNFDKETGQFIKRTSTTVAPFPSLNREALGLVMDGIIKKVNKKSLDDLDPEFVALLKPHSFNQMYAWALVKTESMTGNLAETAGEWVKFPQGSDPALLAASLCNRNTGWCTANIGTATKQLKNGDFYVYFSKNDLGEAKNPRIAIRMEGKKIPEVRGIAANQHEDSIMAGTNILEKKLETFGQEGTLYKKRSRDMKRVTEIEKKERPKQELSQEDLIFIYELDEKIEGFGYERDPRIDKILNKRDMDRDLSLLFGKEKSITVGDQVSPKIASWFEHEDRIGITVKTKSGGKFTRVNDRRFAHLGASWKDEETGLIWSHGAGQKMNQADAIKFCKELGGELPTKEMFEALSGKKGQNLFSDNSNKYWWSSSPVRSYPGNAWVLNVSNGLFYVDNRNYDFSVRCMAR